jgi:hypothetical protein
MNQQRNANDEEQTQSESQKAKGEDALAIPQKLAQVIMQFPFLLEYNTRLALTRLAISSLGAPPSLSPDWQETMSEECRTLQANSALWRVCNVCKG